MTPATLSPHGVCWQWDVFLILLHAPADLITFAVYMLIPAMAIYVYRAGHLSSLYTAYPKLWQLGAGFVFFCGLSHLASFLEIWFGGAVYYFAGANKIIMATVSVLFAKEFWSLRHTMVMIGRVMSSSAKDDTEQRDRAEKE